MTYNWCHGPAGTSQLFAALALAGVDEIADQAGARWRFTEHRQNPPLLPPGTS